MAAQAPEARGRRYADRAKTVIIWGRIAALALPPLWQQPPRVTLSCLHVALSPALYLQALAAALLPRCNAQRQLRSWQRQLSSQEAEVAARGP